MMQAFSITRIDEYQIDEDLKKDLAALLSESFPGFPAGRIYYKQLPSFRFLAWEKDRLIGQLAVEHRIINAGGAPASIFGLSDLCVAPGKQGLKVGSRLLEQVEAEGRQFGIDFLLMVSSEREYFEHRGYRVADNICRWVSIGDHVSFGLVQGRLPGSLMLKSLSGKKWGEGVADFLGYMF